VKESKTDFTRNYCGFYYSDGRIQSSTSKGSRLPVDELDLACQIHDSSYALSDGDWQLQEVADEAFFETTFGKDPTSSAYAVAVLYGNQIYRKIFAIPFGIAALGYGLAASKLPKKSSVSNNDDNYSAFRPRSKEDFEQSKPQVPYQPKLRGSIPDTVYAPESKETEPCVNCDASLQYNPYTTGNYRSVKRNRRKRRNISSY